MAEIRAVTIGLDETMLDRRATFELFVRSQLSRFAPLFRDTDQGRLFDRILELDRDGFTPRDEVFGSVAQEYSLGLEAGEVLAEDFQAHFPHVCVTFPGLEGVLEALMAEGYLLAIITNGAVDIQQRKIDAMGVRSAFKYIAISDAEGHSKPAPELFHLTLERLGVTAMEAVHVGDNPSADITGAKEAGLHAIWLRSRKWPEPTDADLVIEEISELPAAIDQLRGA